MTETETPKTRLKNEIVELATKCTKLKCFIIDNADKLNDGEIYLMKKQLEVMDQYKDILKARLAIWRDSI